MPAPVDEEGIKCALGFITYLSKFMDAPLRQLRKRDVEFVWQPAQQIAFDQLKELCTHPPALKYFDPTKPVVFIFLYIYFVMQAAMD